MFSGARRSGTGAVRGLWLKCPVLIDRLKEAKAAYCWRNHRRTGEGTLVGQREYRIPSLRWDPRSNRTVPKKVNDEKSEWFAEPDNGAIKCSMSRPHFTLHVGRMKREKAKRRLYKPPASPGVHSGIPTMELCCTIYTLVTPFEATSCTVRDFDMLCKAFLAFHPTCKRNSLQSLGKPLEVLGLANLCRFSCQSVCMYQSSLSPKFTFSPVVSHWSSVEADWEMDWSFPLVTIAEPGIFGLDVVEQGQVLMKSAF